MAGTQLPYNRQYKIYHIMKHTVELIDCFFVKFRLIVYIWKSPEQTVLLLFEPKVIIVL